MTDVERALKDLDRLSPTWVAITAWAEDRLAATRAKIDAEGTDALKTEALRGRIAALRELMNLGNDPLEPMPTGPAKDHF